MLALADIEREEKKGLNRALRVATLPRHQLPPQVITAPFTRSLYVGSSKAHFYILYFALVAEVAVFLSQGTAPGVLIRPLIFA